MGENKFTVKSTDQVGHHWPSELASLMEDLFIFCKGLLKDREPKRGGAEGKLGGPGEMALKQVCKLREA